VGQHDDAAGRGPVAACRCGRSRKLADEVFHKDDGLCGACANERWASEHHSHPGDEDAPIDEDDLF